MNLYEKENQLYYMHNGKAFKTTAALQSMVQKSEAQHQSMKAAFLSRQKAENDKKQHCRVGGTSATWGGMPAVQVRVIFKKDYVFHVGLGDGNEYPGTGSCAPAGQRSRVTWCQHGNLIE